MAGQQSKTDDRSERRRKAADPNPRIMIFVADDYVRAADALLEVERASNPNPARPITRLPINFLYFHALELCFKAVIKAHGKNVPRVHDISSLYHTATTLGLVVADTGHAGQYRACLSSLQSANDIQQLRYGLLDGDHLVNALQIQPFARAVMSAADTEVCRLTPELPPKVTVRFVLPGRLTPKNSSTA